MGKSYKHQATTWKSSVWKLWKRCTRIFLWVQMWVGVWGAYTSCSLGCYLTPGLVRYWSGNSGIHPQKPTARPQKWWLGDDNFLLGSLSSWAIVILFENQLPFRILFPLFLLPGTSQVVNGISFGLYIPKTNFLTTLPIKFNTTRHKKHQL